MLDDSATTHLGAYIQIYLSFHPQLLKRCSYFVNSEGGHGVRLHPCHDDSDSGVLYRAEPLPEA